MNKNLSLLMIFLLLVPFTAVLSQNGTQEKCGTEFTPEMEARLLRNIATSKQQNFNKNGVITYVPVKVIRVADNNGSGRVASSSVFEALCGLNTRYLDQDIQFYISGDFKNVNNTAISTHNPVGAAGIQMGLQKVNNAMNMFFCTTVNSSNGGSGITLAYYSPSRDLIAIRNSQATSSSSTLTHEVGHFFSLPHPFNGWEGIDYHASYNAGNPPPISVGGVTVERADGSNNANAGDFFTDTEADYNLGNTVSGCNYNLGAVDPTGAAINPDETLYMSYFDDNCQNRFSPEQKTAITADLNSGARNYLRSNPPSTTTYVTDDATLTKPSNHGIPNGYNKVLLDWDDVTHATKYLVQVSRFSTFSILQEEAVVSQSSYEATSLNFTTKYYWRVMPFNEITTCNGFSSLRDFTTPSHLVGTFDVDGLNSIDLQPNVANNGQSVLLKIDTEKSFEATLSIYNIAGQLVQGQQSITFNTGTTNQEINTSDLTAGMYIVNLRTQKGSVNKKLIITD